MDMASRVKDSKSSPKLILLLYLRIINPHNVLSYLLVNCSTPPFVPIHLSSSENGEKNNESEVKRRDFNLLFLPVQVYNYCGDILRAHVESILKTVKLLGKCPLSSLGKHLLAQCQSYSFSRKLILDFCNVLRLQKPLWILQNLSEEFSSRLAVCCFLLGLTW